MQNRPWILPRYSLERLAAICGPLPCLARTRGAASCLSERKRAKPRCQQAIGALHSFRRRPGLSALSGPLEQRAIVHECHELPTVLPEVVQFPFERTAAHNTLAEALADPLRLVLPTLRLGD